MNFKLITSYLKIISVVILWGGMYHVGKYLVTELDPISVSFIRWFIATIFLYSIYHRENKDNKIIPDAKNIPVLVLSGICGIFIYTLLFFFAEQLISANLVSIIYSFSPACAVILSVIFFKSKTTIVTWAGIAISFIGAISVIYFANPICHDSSCIKPNSNLIIGELLAVCLSICMAIYSLITRRAKSNGISALTITTYGAIFGTILLFICSIFKGNLTHIFSLNLSFWIAMLYASIGANVIGYKWFNDSIADLGITKTVVFQNGVPLATIIIGYVFLQEKISTNTLFSASTIIIGILLTNYSLRNISN